MAKDFVNSGILGGGAGFADGASFRAIKTDDIGSPDYDPRFFETFPTVWAGAYAFRKALEKGGGMAIEEWAALFLLHYFGVLHLASFDERTMMSEYDKDLWPAFHGTYPHAKDESELQSVGILQTDGGTVVGAYYPQVVFFPSRGRDEWQTSDDLKAYLNGKLLSWEKSAVLLEDETDRQRFHRHLRSITGILPRKELKECIESFCNQKLGAFYGELTTLAVHPSGWETIGRREVDPQNLLKKYPFQKPNSGGGTIYYLLTDFDLSYQSSKLTDKISSDLPSPTLYRKEGDHQISVKFAGKTHICELNQGQDKIEMLKDLFLADKPYWCKIPKTAENFAAAVSLKHEVRLQDSTVRLGDRAICLAPVRAEFLTHFPEVLKDVNNIKAEPDAEGNVTWTFFICDKEVRWRSKPIQKSNIPNSTLSMYPPKVSPHWKLYAAYGTGNRETCGRWQLIDERGWRGPIIELEEEEYVSVLHRADGARNRPRALLFNDVLSQNNYKERGILFLTEFPEEAMDNEQTATLATDFGTSNTCLAVNAGEAQILNFTLSPLPLWGTAQEKETPGFVPRSWSGEKGFFPTILLSRKFDEDLPSVEPDKLLLEHLFKVDIPCLHKKMGERLVANVFDAQWRLHDNLKWSADQRTPWRSLFLQSVLFYAHAEVFFTKKARLNKYVFTYPLAFSEDYGSTYHDRAQDAIRQIRHFCYGEERHLEGTFNYLKMDESTAIAKSLRQGGVRGLLEVFVDIGGGTADVAIRNESQFLVLDSLKVAGRSFFNIAKKTLDDPALAGSSQYRKHLEQLLGKDPKALQLRLPLGALYSVQINELDDRTFREREEAIIKKGMGRESFQRYRSQLFFSHLLAYALLQACAAAVAHKLTLTNGIKLVLGGNGWGLLLFAEWKRSSELLRTEANAILALLKKNLLENASEEEKPYLEKIYLSGVALLNERNLSEAKNSVALGALQAVASDAPLTTFEPYAGINIRDLRIEDYEEPHTVRWCDRWSLDALTGMFGNMRQIKSASFAHPDELSHPMDANLAVFTGLGNTSRVGVDNLPADQWQQMNSELIGCVSQMTVEGGKLIVESGDGEKISAAPLNYFLSRVLYPANAQRDFLDALADVNGNLYADKK